MRAFVAIGSNIGDRLQNIAKAVKYLGLEPGITIKKVSSLLETDPVGGPPQGKFINGVIKIETALSARELLKRLQKIESSLGRARTVKDGPRTLDLDILLYGKSIINEPDLTIPHPRMLEREFVMKPLLEIEPNIKNKWSSQKKSRKPVRRLIQRARNTNA
ncbi:MAG: 2-amino-4-hydroxy-6-hydroxymethyldihydropteridine diphosphokinase [Candidatus Omnitrophica bacterium]|nr:2-amino-4-hydroxy-6-hydroxymethyldihydropteridine diphosphokinase [Candidatus Omnitrophota bacterium]